MAKKVFKTRAITSRDEIDPRKVRRDTRTIGERIGSALKTPEILGSVFIFMGLVVVIFPVMLIPVILTWMFLMLIGWGEAAYQTLPGKIPNEWRVHLEWVKKIPLVGSWLHVRATTDWNDPKPGWNGYEQARGEVLWGYERDTRQEVYLTADEMKTHMLIFGTTGAGKSESLLSIGWNALSMGTGLFYSDAKGTNKLALQIWSMARFVGRDDDFLLINYITGNKSTKGRQPERISNTVNPFNYGSADFLADIVISLSITSTGDDKNAVFTDGAIQLMKSLMVGLVEMRDQGRINLSVRVIREWLSLDKCIELSEDESLSEFARETMREYLKKIPGFIEGKSAAEQGEKTLEQFGYNQFYFRRALSMLTDSYGHIYGSLMGEVDFKDIVFNRRIVCVTLPALEKAPAELSQLARVILAGLRSALSMGLGNKAEGSKEEMIDALPSNSEKPTLYILDEYGYQAVDGFAVTAAQARSLGAAMIYAGQDYAGFKRENEKEAEQVVANTKFKSVMALEDPQSTWSLIRDLAGEGVFSEVDGFELGQESGAYNPGANARLNRASRIDLMDLRQQIEGDFHLFYKDTIIRGSMFYAGPDISGGMQIAQLCEIEKPDAKEISKRYTGLKETKEVFERLFRGELKIDREKDAAEAKNFQKSLQFVKDLNVILDFSKPRMGVQDGLIGLALLNLGGGLSKDGNSGSTDNKSEAPRSSGLNDLFEKKNANTKQATSQSPLFEGADKDVNDVPDEADRNATKTADLVNENDGGIKETATDIITGNLAQMLGQVGESVEKSAEEAGELAKDISEGLPTEYPTPPKPQKDEIKRSKAIDGLMSLLDDLE